MDAGAPALAGLTDDDLEALRLGAQVLAHRAGPVRHPAVAVYFSELEAAVKAEIALRATSPGEPERQAVADRAPIRLVATPPTDAEDRRLVAEYLGLLVANERLSPAVRDACRALRARDTR